MHRSVFDSTQGCRLIGFSASVAALASEMKASGTLEEEYVPSCSDCEASTESLRAQYDLVRFEEEGCEEIFTGVRSAGSVETDSLAVDLMCIFDDETGSSREVEKPTFSEIEQTQSPAPVLNKVADLLFELEDMEQISCAVEEEVGMFRWRT